MSLVEVCDVCGKPINDRDGIFLRVKDIQEAYDTGCPDVPLLEKYKYKIHVCDKCVHNIKRYCIEHSND